MSDTKEQRTDGHGAPVEPVTVALPTAPPASAPPLSPATPLAPAAPHAAEPGRITRSATRIAKRYEPRHPDWLVQHSLTFGWLWAFAWILVLIAADHWSWSGWLWLAIIVVAMLPVVLSTVVVLSQTPHSHLHHDESILSHFFVKFVGYVFAFFVWVLSVVLSAALSAQLAADAGDSQTKTFLDGFNVIAAAMPTVTVLLWIALVARYSWFLSQLRGWRARPIHTRIPGHLLHHSPRTRQLVLGLAHPGLLFVTGLFLTVVILALIIDDVTINLV